MARRTESTLPHPGTYKISTGEATIVADDLRPGAFLLTVNGVPSSHIVPGNPGVLEFEYMRWMALVAREVVDTRLDADRLRLTHLGGGACTLARYCADRWPGSRNTVVELDERLAALVREQFDIPRAPRVKIRVGDARAVTDGFRPASRDIIFRDVFATATTPHSLTTVEFYAQVSASLAPGGVYLANCGTHSDLAEARAEIAGMSEVFAHLAVIADPPMLKGRRYGNVVLVGSNLPIEYSPAFTRALLTGAVPAQLKDDAWTRRLASGTAPRRDGSS